MYVDSSTGTQYTLCMICSYAQDDAPRNLRQLPHTDAGYGIRWFSTETFVLVLYQLKHIRLT